MARARTFLAAFADGAVLFPLIAILSQRAGFSFSILCLSAGVLYFISGLFFRIPMAVQPLKSICLSAVALGATYHEIRLGGACVGFICLLFLVGGGKALLERIPNVTIRGLQFSLGLLLILQGIQSSSPWQFATLGFCILLNFHFPVLGILAFMGFVAGLFLSVPSKVIEVDTAIRIPLLVGLVVPQIVLTLTNSVVAAELTAQQYYQEKASRVTCGNLLLSIGVGNLVTSLFGGLPFCHGSGGITAHYRAGARHWVTNIVIAITLIVIGLLPINRIQYPPFLLGALLILIGVFHLQLARPVLRCIESTVSVILMGVITLLTQNLLIAFMIGLFWELIIPKMVKNYA